MGGVFPSFATGGRERGELVSGGPGPPNPESPRLALHLLDLQIEFDLSLAFKSVRVRVPRDLNVRADCLSYVSAVRPSRRHCSSA